MKYFKILLLTIRQHQKMQDKSKMTIAKQAVLDRDIAQAVEKERGRLFNFIRKRVKSTLDAEDILQDVFYQFVRISSYEN